MDNLLRKIEELHGRFLRLKQILRIGALMDELNLLRSEMEHPGFWQDRERAVSISKKAEDINTEIEKWAGWERELIELRDFLEISLKEGEESFFDELDKKFSSLEKKFNGLEFLALFSGKYDQDNAIVSIYAGVGGVDAQDWTEMLERMILRYCEQKNYTVEMLDRSIGNEAGIKSTSFRVSGRYAFGYLKGENGVHRLVRISPFDAEDMRHTSFALMEVIPELPEAEAIEIKDDEVKMDFYHSSGPGGQNVNKTSSAVRLVHVPTGIVVTCQTERSQHQNREIAFRILKSKLTFLSDKKREDEESKLKSGIKVAEWGKQIRSYVLQPYQLVKDHRSNFETTDTNGVLNGDLDGFAEAYLKWLKNGQIN